MLDTDRYLLERAGDTVSVEPQVFDVLAYLIENRDRVVTKEELLDSVWGDRFVSESALTSRIKRARQLVGDDGAAQRVIKTVHGRGYRWIGDVETQRPAADLHEEERPPRPASTQAQRIHVCRAEDGARIAYALTGNGPPLVRAAHWITHLEYDWQSPVWRHWLEGLSRWRTLVRYDERGCGLSDHDPAELTFESFVRDLEVVVDQIGLDRFPLLGVSQGGAVAIEYAHRHPERVSGLILVGAYARGRARRPEHPESGEDYALQREMMRLGWGRDDPSHRLYFSSSFIPDGPAWLWAEFAELMRRTASAENAVRIIDACAAIDVTASAAALDVPTLILHGVGDVRIPFEQSVELATAIRNSRLVPLDTRNHLLREDEPAWARLLAELDEFLGDGGGDAAGAGEGALGDADRVVDPD
jgi:pimeloyl-ACP methyl ester carboxylesterase/DNA-binding winged helix-turn-helix (wHTH) protein